MQLLQNCIGPTIRIGQESWCLLYAGFFVVTLKETMYECEATSTKLCEKQPT